MQTTETVPSEIFSAPLPPSETTSDSALVDRHRKIFKILQDFLKNRYEYCSILKVS